MSRREEVKQIFSLFETPEGKRLLREINKICNLDGDTFSKDERTSCYMQGRRSVAIEIKKILGENKNV